MVWSPFELHASKATAISITTLVSHEEQSVAIEITAQKLFISTTPFFIISGNLTFHWMNLWPKWELNNRELINSFRSNCRFNRFLVSMCPTRRTFLQEFHQREAKVFRESSELNFELEPKGNLQKPFLSSSSSSKQINLVLNVKSFSVEGFHFFASSILPFGTEKKSIPQSFCIVCGGEWKGYEEQERDTKLLLCYYMWKHLD